MGSRFAHEIQSTRRQLLGKLVKNIIGVEDDDENFSIAVDFCQQNLDYHRFADTNPYEVRRNYSGIEKSMVDQTQYEKAQVLHALRGRFYGLALKEDFSDVHDSIMELLWQLAGNPLESSMDSTTQARILDLLYNTNDVATRLPGEDTTRLHDHPDALDSEPYSDEPYADHYDGTSDLSEWSDTEEAAPSTQPKPGPLDHTQQQDQARQPQDPPFMKPLIIESSPPPEPAPKQPPLPPIIHELQPQLALLQPSDPLYQISHLRHDFQQLQSSCYTQDFIAQEALTLLQGGSCHLASLHNGHWAVHPHICTPSMSPGPLHRLLQAFAAAGTCARFISQLCTSIRTATSTIITHTNPGAAPSSADTTSITHTLATATVPLLSSSPACTQQHLQLTVTPVLRAFAAAAQQQLQHVWDFATSLQQQLASSELSLTLLQLHRHCSGSTTSLHNLAAICRTVLAKLSSQPCTPADVSTLVLDSLLLQLLQQDQRVGALSASMRSQLLHLFLAAAVPYLDALEVWLYQGHVNNLPPDFFMQSNITACLQDPCSWYQGYAHSSSAAGLDVPCPKFLKPLLDSITTAGKSLRLMGHIERSEAAEAARAAARLLPHYEASDQDLGSDLDYDFDQEFDLDFDFDREAAAPQQEEADAAEQHVLAAVVCQQLKKLLRQAQEQQQEELLGLLPGGLCELAAAAAAAQQRVGGAGELLGKVLQGQVWEEFEIATAPVPAAAAAAAAAAAGKGAGGQQQASPRSVLDLHHEAEGAADSAGGGAGISAARRKWSDDDTQDAAAAQEPAEAEAEAAQPEEEDDVATAAAVQPEEQQQQEEQEDVNHHLEWFQQMLSAMQQGGLQPMIHTITNPAAPPSSAAAPAAGTQLLLQELWPLHPLPTELPLLTSKPTTSTTTSQAALMGPNGAIRLQQLQQHTSSNSPAIGFLLEEALQAVIQPRMQDVGQALLGCLLADWGLMKELLVLRNVFLMGSPAMCDWADALVARLLGSPSMTDITEQQLEDALAEAFAQASLDEVLPELDAMLLVIDDGRLREAGKCIAQQEQRLRNALQEEAEQHRKGLVASDHQYGVSSRLLKEMGDAGAAAGAAAGDSQLTFLTVEVLDALQLSYSSTWLTGMLAEPQIGKVYGGALSFILKLRYVKAMLTRSTRHLWKQRQHIEYPRFTRAAVLAREAAEQPRPSSMQPAPYGAAAPAASTSRRLLGQGGSVPPPAVVQFGAYDEVMALHEMMTAVDALQEYVMEQLQHEAWPAFEQQLHSCSSLDEVRSSHSQLMATITEVCFMAAAPGAPKPPPVRAGLGKRDKTAHFILVMLQHIMQFCYLQQHWTSRAEHMPQAEPGSLQAAARARAVLMRKLRMSWHLQQFRRAYCSMCRSMNVLAVMGAQHDLRSLLGKLDCNGWASAQVVGMGGKDLAGMAVV